VWFLAPGLLVDSNVAGRFELPQMGRQVPPRCKLTRLSETEVGLFGIFHFIARL
jgi:hypothetical protein